MDSGRARLGQGNEMLQKARQGGSLLVESRPSRCLSMHSLSLLSSFSLLCTCVPACPCAASTGGPLLNGEAFLHPPKARMQASSKMEILDNYSSSSSFI